MSYGKVHETYWDGEKIEPLSDRAALLGLYLIAGPHRNAIGCFKLGIGTLSDVERFKKWGIEGISEALHEMVETGFIVRDERTNWTFITNALTKDPIKGPKAAIHAAKLAAAVPASSPVYAVLKQRLEPQLEREKKALSDADGWPMRSPIEGVSKDNRSPSPFPEPLPAPAPEPEPCVASAPPAAEPAEPPAMPEPAQPTEPAKPDPDLLAIPDFLDRRKRGCRLPDGWQPSHDLLRWAGEERPDLDLARTVASFGDYWRAKPGQAGVKTDWDATFRNWVRNERPGPNAPRAGAPGNSATMRALDELGQRFGGER